MDKGINVNRTIRLFFRVSYTHDATPTLNNSINRILDDIDLRLQTVLEEIPLHDIIYYSKDVRTEKIEGILHCFFNLDVNTILESEIYALQNSLESNRKIGENI